MGYLYENILGWIWGKVGEIPDEEQFEWIVLVYDAVEQVMVELEKKAGFVWVEEYDKEEE